MNQVPQNVNLDTAKNFTFAAYILFFMSVISAGLFGIIGLIISYVKRNDVEGTVFHSHFSYLIKTFWIMFIIQLIGFVFIAVKGIGFIVIIITYLWFIYRLVSGFSKLSENRAI